MEISVHSNQHLQLCLCKISLCFMGEVKSAQTILDIITKLFLTQVNVDCPN